MSKMGEFALGQSERHYPETPGYVRHSDTSYQASKSIAPQVGKIALQVYEQINCWIGATCDEIEANTGLSHQTASARMRELALMGRIRKAGERRKTRSGRNAEVWEVTGQV